MNHWQTILFGIIAASWLLEGTVELLNLQSSNRPVPDEFTDLVDDYQYRRSQSYLQANTRFDLIHSSVTTILLIVAICFGLLNRADYIARACVENVVLRGLVFGAIIGLAWFMIGLPFSIYQTFVIEERFGFNRTNAKTFIMDRIKMIGLVVVIGAPIFGLIVWFFDQIELAWLWAWAAITLVKLVGIFVAPVLILPLFNKYEPMEDGELKQAVLNYADEQNFMVNDVFIMDGSKRSTKANALFIGFGRFRRIVLFDTLVSSYSAQQLLSVLAHEMGHLKHRHIPKLMVLQVLCTGIVLFMISLLIKVPQVFQAFGMTEQSTYAGLLFFGILFEPINLLMHVTVYAVARRFEFQADHYAATTVQNGARSLSESLRRLTVDGLGQLNPHPLKVIMEYSHPPVVDRVRSLAALAEDDDDPTPAPLRDEP